MKETLRKCFKKIKDLHCDALLVSNPSNILYLTGFSRHADGYLLLTREGGVFYFTNFLYAAQARGLDIWKVLVSRGSIFALMSEQIKKLGFTRVGFEAKHLPFLEYEKLKEHLNAAAVDFSQTIDVIEEIRSVKNRTEIALIRESTLISKEAFDYAGQICRTVRTEKQLSIEIEKFLRLKGDNEIAFPTIVAGGKNSAYPHHEPKADELYKNFFLIDLGSRYCEYCTDLTRVFFEGKISPFARKIYDIVLKAQELAIKTIKAGVSCRQVDGAARRFIEEKGYAKHFGHGLGHGVGIDVHELPYLNPRNEQILQEGMIVTIEPAIYLEGKLGVRIEDVVLVGSRGCTVLSA
ncbi:MAG: Xaa-Pro peptidase family protein [Candidatus Omnitrophica bacterium]|nr:Xaa-Pro peptidase family protein [Candidatus Omnitrophota bacterium]